MTTVYFIRHGESMGNVTNTFTGVTDVPLTQKGEAQAALTAKYLKDVPFTAVYSSHLQRAYRTGCAIAAPHGLTVTPCEGLAEINGGEWENVLFDELTNWPDFDTWKNHIGLATCPGGESVEQLQNRVREAVEDIVRRHPGETICIACHATPIRVMSCIWRGLALSQMHMVPWVGNASVTIVEYDENGGSRLIKESLTDHLGEISTFLPPDAC